MLPLGTSESTRHARIGSPPLATPCGAAVAVAVDEGTRAHGRSRVLHRATHAPHERLESRLE